LGVLFGSRLVAAAFVALLVCTVITLGIQNLSLRASLEANQRSFYPWRYEPTVASFWSNFLDVPQETDVLVPDASFSQIQSFSQTSI
jgi:peptidoglycan/LPS O-acetylase OafA/YrhL